MGSIDDIIEVIKIRIKGRMHILGQTTKGILRTGIREQSKGLDRRRLVMFYLK